MAPAAAAGGTGAADGHRVLDVHRGDLQRCTIGRLELVQWVNALLQLDVQSCSDCSDCVAYCQVLDLVSPGSVPLHKLVFNATSAEHNRRNLRRAAGRGRARGALGARERARATRQPG